MANTNVFTGADGSITLSTNSAEGPEAATAQAIIDGNDLVAVGRATGVRVEVNTAIRAFNEIGRADFFLASLRSYPVLLPKAGVASAEETQAFVDDQLRASEAGAFFAGYNFVTYILRRPG